MPGGKPPCRHESLHLSDVLFLRRPRRLPGGRPPGAAAADGPSQQAARRWPRFPDHRAPGHRAGPGTARRLGAHRDLRRARLHRDQAPARGLAPARDSDERYRLIEWLSFISTEVHKKHLAPLFSRRAPAAVKEWARQGTPETLAHPARHLSSRPYLVGDGFTVADAYLGWALLVLPQAGVPLDPWPSLVAYLARVQARPSVARALAIEYPLYRSEEAPAPAAATG